MVCFSPTAITDKAKATVTIIWCSQNTLPKGALMVVLSTGFSILIARTIINIRFVGVKSGD